jgi:hypothetical protein
MNLLLAWYLLSTNTFAMPRAFCPCSITGIITAVPTREECLALASARSLADPHRIGTYKCSTRIPR